MIFTWHEKYKRLGGMDGVPAGEGGRGKGETEGEREQDARLGGSRAKQQRVGSWWRKIRQMNKDGLETPAVCVLQRKIGRAHFRPLHLTMTDDRKPQNTAHGVDLTNWTKKKNRTMSGSWILYRE